MTRPLVSIVIPAYNAEDTLAEALESVFAQEYEPFEMILVDDGSDDGTAAVAGSFSGLTYLRQENRGPSAARNNGVRHAGGELVAFLDADDLLPPDKLTVQVRFLLEHPHIACVLGRQELLEHAVPVAETLPRDPVFGDLAGVPLMSMVIRRDAFMALGGFDEAMSHAEDRELLVRMRAAGMGIEFLPDVVLHRRLDGRNLTFRAPEQHPVFGSLKSKLDRDRRLASGSGRP